MLQYMNHADMGRQCQASVDSRFHFSFADYFNPKNVRFGALRAVNDALVMPGCGLERSSHRDMEMLTYVVRGELTHDGPCGKRFKLSRGCFQYVSAGAGINHREWNSGSEVLRYLQIWITPNRKGLFPSYQVTDLDDDSRKGQWRTIAAPADEATSAPVQLHADAHIYTAVIPKGETAKFAIGKGRQAYVIQVEGQSKIVKNGQVLREGDALELVEEDLQIRALRGSHLLIIEIEKA